MIYIQEAKRLPQGRFGGALKGIGSVGLGVDLLKNMNLEKPSHLIWGIARSHTQGMNPARTIALKAGLPESTYAWTLNMACGSSLQAVLEAARLIRLGEASHVLCGGSEAMSDTPHLIPGLRWGFEIGHRSLPDVMHQDGLRCPLTGLLMGETIEDLARRRGISREASDRYALRSHQRAAQADFTAEILSHPNLSKDECIRPQQSLAALAKLSPVFRKEGQLTPGNCSALSDGAAALCLSSLREGSLARILGWSEAALAPIDMGEGPVPAVRQLLAQQGLQIKDIDLWELNEAFAAQVLVCLQQLGLPEDKLNVAGGGISLGHPIGASGARILVTLVHQLRPRGGGLGIATLGIGGGLGQAVLVEVFG